MNEVNSPSSLGLDSIKNCENFLLFQLVRQALAGNSKTSNRSRGNASIFDMGYNTTYLPRMIKFHFFHLGLCMSLHVFERMYSTK